MRQNAIEGNRPCKIVLIMVAALASLSMGVISSSVSAQMTPEMQACTFPPDNDLEHDKQLANCRKLVARTNLPLGERAFAASQMGSLHVSRYQYGAAGRRNDPAELDRAIAAYDQAVKLAPDSPWYYKGRAEVWSLKGQYRRAVADHSEQVRLNPKRHEAYQDRAEACRATGDFKCAINDYSAQIKLVPFLANAYLRRGQAHYLNGDYAAALPDMVRANRPVDAYAMIWLYLTQKRLGQDARAELVKNAKRLRSEDWPFQIIDFILERRPEDQVLTGMGVRKIMKVDERVRCQANFYLGEIHVLKGARELAKKAYTSASRADCPRRPWIRAGTRFDAMETFAAQAQLKKY